MNFVFRQYPQHPWFPGWSFEPRDRVAQLRQRHLAPPFCTGKEIGHIQPDQKRPHWTFQIPLPKNYRTNLLANGFCAYSNQQKKQQGVEFFTPEPGVLWGHNTGLPPCTLLNLRSGETVEIEKAWIETSTSGVLLMQKDFFYCLVTNCASQAEAERISKKYLSEDFEQWLQTELHYRQGARNLIKDLPRHDALSTLCIESMIKALKPPEGRIPMRWSQSPNTPTPWFDINELFPLALAWSHIDAETAEELILCALKMQSNSGALPSGASPTSTNAMLEAPKPLMAKTAEQVWEARKNEAWLNTAVPLIRRHIQWMLSHFDPKRRKIYSWQNRNEPIEPKHFEGDLVSADLAALLITEIEALNRLQDQVPPELRKDHWFKEEHDQLKQSLLDQFWNDSTGLFSNAYRRGKLVTVKGLPTLIPLLWKKLPQSQKNITFDRIRQSDLLFGKNEALSWKNSISKEQSFPTLRYFIIIEALKTVNPNSNLLTDFSRITLQRFAEWHSTAIESNAPLPLNASTAALIIHTQALSKSRYHGTGKVPGFFIKLSRRLKINKTDSIIVLATVFTLLCVRAFYHEKEVPIEYAALEKQLSSAMTTRNTEEILKTCQEIIEKHPKDSAYARLLIANNLLLSERFQEAEEQLRQVIKLEPDSPSAMISLGLTLQLQGKYKEADQYYSDFCYIFERIYPDVVEQINLYREIMREDVGANQNGPTLLPPRWKTLYTLDFMNKIELIPEQTNQGNLL